MKTFNLKGPLARGATEAASLQSVAQVDGYQLFASPPITSTHQSIKARMAGDR